MQIKQIQFYVFVSKLFIALAIIIKDKKINVGGIILTLFLLIPDTGISSLTVENIRYLKSAFNFKISHQGYFMDKNIAYLNHTVVH